jgi:hypothetical protein
MTLTTRAAKGSALTHPEMDANWAHCLDRLNMTGAEIAAGIFVKKGGDDDYPGTHWDKPKATWAGAMAAAAAMIPPGTPGAGITIAVEVLDGGDYTEAVAIPGNVKVFAPAATLHGPVTLTSWSDFHVDRHYATADNQTLLTLIEAGADEGPARYSVNFSMGFFGGGNLLDGVRNVRNAGGTGKNLFVDFGIMLVGTNGVGVGDETLGGGHIHLEGRDLYMGGNGSIGIQAGAEDATATRIVGMVHHILPPSNLSPTNTTAIKTTHSSASVKLVAAEIIATTAYDVVDNTLFLTCPRITGVISGTPANINGKVPVPAAASSAGQPGMWAADATHFYACVAPDTWVRSSLGTWS